MQRSGCITAEKDPEHHDSAAGESAAQGEYDLPEVSAEEHGEDCLLHGHAGADMRGEAEGPGGEAEPPGDDAVAEGVAGDVAVSEADVSSDDAAVAEDAGVTEDVADDAGEPGEDDSTEDVAAEDVAVEDDAVRVDAPEPVGEPAPVAPRTSRGRRVLVFVRRGLVAASVAALVALAVSAFATAGPTTADVDQRFLTDTQAQGHVVPAGDQQMLLVSAARKICDRRVSHTTAADRRATALSPQEIDVVQETFVDDTRGFTSLALETYCPN